MKRFFGFALIVLLAQAPFNAWADTGGEVLFQADFEGAEDELPEGLMVLDGEFSIKETPDGRSLHLPGKPLSEYGCLIGPPRMENAMVRARIKSEPEKRLRPRFGVGLNGFRGFKLRVVPARRAVELVLGDEKLTEAPFAWKGGEWTELTLRIVKRESDWLVEGRAAQTVDGATAEATVSHVETAEPITGPASIWGTPYSGRDIWFDDLAVRETAE